MGCGLQLNARSRIFASGTHPCAGKPQLYAPCPHIHHPRETEWRDYHLATIPPEVKVWLLDAGSLTQRLIAASHNHFRVQLLQHCWQRPRLSESRALGMKEREWAIVREVILRCHDQPWVFARSIIPASSLGGHLRRLRRFSDNSLGELLFRDPSMQRCPFEVARIDGESRMLPAQLRHSATLWGRRCRFELAQKPILVAEIFLPAFEPWVGSKTDE